MHIMFEQVRAARAFLGLDQGDAARLANVPVEVVRQMEASDGAPVEPAVMDRVRAALEEAGIEFIPDGVRRRRRDAATLFEDLRAISIRSAERQGHANLTDADLYGEDGLPA